MLYVCFIHICILYVYVYIYTWHPTPHPLALCHPTLLECTMAHNTIPHDICLFAYRLSLALERHFHENKDFFPLVPCPCLSRADHKH